MLLGLAQTKDANAEPLVTPNPIVSIPGVSYSDYPLMEKCGTKQCLIIPFIAQYISGFYRYLLGIGLVAAAIMLVYAGFLYIMGATGLQISDAKSKITDALIGLAILVASYAILANVSPATLKFEALRIPIVTHEPWKGEVENVATNMAGQTPSSKCSASGKIRDFKQYEPPWGPKAFGSKPVCTKEQMNQDMPGDTSVGDKPKVKVSSAPGAPCCMPYAGSACGITSLADVLASYGESVTPEDIGTIYVKNNLRNCNYGGSNPAAALNAWQKEKGIDKYVVDGDVAATKTSKLEDVLKGGRPVIFLCNKCQVCHAKGACKTYGGHWMVLTGVLDDENYSIVDPGGMETFISKKLQNVGNLIYIRPKDNSAVKGCQ